MKDVTYNYFPITPSVNDTTYTWEVKNLPAVDLEPLGPTLSSLVPRVAVSYAPGANVSMGSVRSFSSWLEVSRWLSGLNDPQVIVTPEMIAKANELIVSAKNELDKIRMLGGYVQKTQYISIQTGIGKGDGYRPHPAPEIFTRQYGDCKDKATLMRALLKAVGFDSYAVSIYSSDRTFVQESFPSPQQFNHAIVAIRVSTSTQAYPVVDHPVLGRLLFFDPTSPYLAGTLPLAEQGSLVLVNAEDKGALLRLPVSPPPSNIAELRLEATLLEDGTIASVMLNGRAWQPPKIRFGDLKTERLMILKPPFVGNPPVPSLTSQTRKYPVLLNPVFSREVVKLKIPPDFRVDEDRDPVTLETPFGRYSSTCGVRQNEMTCSREYQIRFATVSVDQYGALRDFFQRIQIAEQVPIVLVRN